MTIKLLKTHYQTTIHKFQVLRFILKACYHLIKRAIVHDFSKYSKYEAPYFANACQLKDLTYGSPEYKKCLEESLAPALKHHYANNSHHPEFYPNGIHDMNPLDIIELLCDWKAATLRHSGADILQSLEINKKRFNYNDQMMDNFIKFYNETNSLK